MTPQVWMTTQVWIAAVIGVAATVEDLAHRKISNWICGTALAAGLVLHIVSDGWRGGLTALLGAVTGFGVFLIFYLLGGMGGGDVKLMAGFGAVLGVNRLLEAALWTAACGGIFATLAIGFHALRGLWRRPAKVDDGSRSAVPEKRRLQSIPYAPAIAAGVLLSLVPKM
jgi:prepilin peptidase CpaA